MTEMLQRVVTGGSGATGKAANFTGQDIAGKTGYDHIPEGPVVCGIYALLYCCGLDGL